MARRLTGTTRLTHEQWALLALMRVDNSVAEPQYRPDLSGWQKLVTEFEISFTLRASAPLKLSSTMPASRHLLLTVLPTISFATFQLYQCSGQHDRWAPSNDLKATQRVGVAAGRHVLVYDDTVSNTWDVLISLHSLFAIAEYAPQVFVGPVALLDSGAVGVALGMCCSASTRLQCT